MLQLAAASRDISGAGPAEHTLLYASAAVDTKAGLCAPLPLRRDGCSVALSDGIAVSSTGTIVYRQTIANTSPVPPLLHTSPRPLTQFLRKQRV